jgi:hypothetical protein
MDLHPRVVPEMVVVVRLRPEPLLEHWVQRMAVMVSAHLAQIKLPVVVPALEPTVFLLEAE